LKEHLTHTGGNVRGCPNVTNDIRKRVLASMNEKDKKKKEKLRKDEILRQFTVEPGEDNDVEEEDEIEIIEGGTTQAGKPPRTLKRKAASDVRGPLDAMLKPDYNKLIQATLDRNNPIKEKLKMAAWKEFAVWAYSVGLPFNVVRDENFQKFIYVVGKYGRGMSAPSYHNIRVTLLKDVPEDTK